VLSLAPPHKSLQVHKHKEDCHHDKRDDQAYIKCRALLSGKRKIDYQIVRRSLHNNCYFKRDANVKNVISEDVCPGSLNH
jgi:hypothetical protein